MIFRSKEMFFIDTCDLAWSVSFLPWGKNISYDLSLSRVDSSVGLWCTMHHDPNYGSQILNQNAHPKIKLVPWQDFLGVQTSEFPNPFNAAFCSYGKKRFWCKPLHNSVNKPFYTCLFSDMAFEWQRSWRWPCFDRPRCFCRVNQVVLMLTSPQLH